MLMKDGKTVMTVSAPSDSSMYFGAVANVSLDVSATDNDEVRKHSRIKVVTDKVRGVVFVSTKAPHDLYIRFPETTPPAYYSYFLHTGIKQEILDYVWSLCQQKEGVS